LDYASYLRVLLSLWVALGMAQLVQAFHRLARFEGTVRWDWLPVVWAALSFLFMVETWWVYFELIESPIWANLFAFLAPLNVFVVLYLICASALPDVSRRCGERTVDLTAHYLSQRGYFFGLWAILLALAVAVSGIMRGRFAPDEDGYRVAGVATAFVMAASERRRLHVVVTLLAVAVVAAYMGRFTTPAQTILGR